MTDDRLRHLIGSLAAAWNRHEALRGELEAHPGRAGSKWYTDRQRGLELEWKTIRRLVEVLRTSSEDATG